MDPNAALRMIDEADRVDAETREVMRGLNAWLARGGFAPDWEAYPKGARRFRKMFGLQRGMRTPKLSGHGHATKKTKGSRDWVVILDGSYADGTAIYLGELDRGIRQGVRKLENATLFTKAGAQRVLAGYPTDVVAGRAYIMKISPSQLAGHAAPGRAARSHATIGSIGIGDIVQRADIDSKNRYVVTDVSGPWIFTRRISGTGGPGVITFLPAAIRKVS